MVTCQGKCNFDKLSAKEHVKAVESVEKSEDFPTLTTAVRRRRRRGERGSSIAVIIEKPATKKETSSVTRECRIVYNQAAAGKEWHSKQGSTGTCSYLTK